jgi:hypothetical protein
VRNVASLEPSQALIFIAAVVVIVALLLLA